MLDTIQLKLDEMLPFHCLPDTITEWNIGIGLESARFRLGKNIICNLLVMKTC